MKSYLLNLACVTLLIVSITGGIIIVIQQKQLRSMQVKQTDDKTGKTSVPSVAVIADKTTVVASKIPREESSLPSSSEPDLKTSPTAKADSESNIFGASEGALSNEQIQKLLLQVQSSQLDTKYAELFKELAGKHNFSPDQLSKLKSLLIQKQQTLVDAAQAARDAGITPDNNPAAFQAAISQAMQTINDDLRSTLGAHGYASYQEFENTLPQRNAVDWVRQTLDASQSPLTIEQSKSLLAIFNEDQANRRSTIDPRDDVEETINSLLGNTIAKISAAGQARAGTVLSRAQIQIVQDAIKELARLRELLKRKG